MINGTSFSQKKIISYLYHTIKKGFCNKKIQKFLGFSKNN